MTDFLLALADKDQLYVADLYGGSQPEHRVKVRVINELAWHNLFIRTLLVRPEADELRGFRPRVHDHRPAELPRRSRAPRLPQRDGRRGQLRQEADPDRRHGLCRRDEEVGVRPAQLPPAAARASCRCIARPTSVRTATRRSSSACQRHRQDDLVGRPQPHADRRRRARLVGHRGLQFRRRLLRQDDPTVGRSPSPKSTRRPSASARCSRMSSIDPVTRELDLDDRDLCREQPRRLPDRFHPEFVRPRTWARCPRTS